MQPMIPRPRSLNLRRFNESQQQYELITLPHILEQLKGANKDTKWVYNILEGKQEAERVVYRDWHPDNGFLLLPKISWEKRGFLQRELYFHAFVLSRDIRTIRDLRGRHLPLLLNLSARITSYLMNHYGIASGHFRMFFHYHPQAYHLHLHVTLNWLTRDRDRRNVYLEQVIANISQNPSYYENATLPIHLDKYSVLCRKFMPKKKKRNWRSNARK